MASHRYVGISPIDSGDDPFGDTGASYAATYSDISSAITSEVGNFTTGGDHTVATVLHIECLAGEKETIIGSGNLIFDGWKTDRAVDGSYIEIRSFWNPTQKRILKDDPSSVTQPMNYMYNVESTAALEAVVLDNDSNSLNFLDIDFVNMYLSHTGELNKDRVILHLDNAYHKQINFIGCYIWCGSTEKLMEDKANQPEIDLKFVNCVFDSTRDTYSVSGKEALKFQNNDSKNSVKIINCTIFGAATGIVDDGAITIMKNCALFYNSTDFSATYDTVPDYCAFDDTESFTNSVDISPSGDEDADHEKAFDGPLSTSSRPNVSVGSKSSVLYRAGKSRVDDPDIPAVDILGYPRPYGQVTIGAFEYRWEYEHESKIMGTEIPTRPCGSNGFTKFMGVG